MLILTRRKGQTIRIGDDIVVKVLSVNPLQVRIGVSAPPTVHLLRKEVHERDLRLKDERGEP